MPFELREEKRIQMTDRVGLPRLYMAWPTVPMFADNEADLEILADVLAGGKTSRLYQALVREKQIAQEVEVYQDSEELAGQLFIVATARPGHTIAELEAAVLDELHRIQAQPPSGPEVSRAVSRFEAQLSARWNPQAVLTAGRTGSTCTTSSPEIPATWPRTSSDT